MTEKIKLTREDVDKQAAALWSHFEGEERISFEQLAADPRYAGLVIILRHCAWRVLETVDALAYPQTDGDAIAARIISGDRWPNRRDATSLALPLEGMPGEVAGVVKMAQTSELSASALAIAGERERCARIAETTVVANVGEAGIAGARSTIAHAIRAGRIE